MNFEKPVEFVKLVDTTLIEALSAALQDTFEDRWPNGSVELTLECNYGKASWNYDVFSDSEMKIEANGFNLTLVEAVAEIDNLFNNLTIKKD